MYMIYHGDREDMLVNEPKCFDSKEEAVDYAEKIFKRGIPLGHALTLYDCSERRTWQKDD